MRGENDNHTLGRASVYLPSARAVFLPAMAILAGCAVLLAGIERLGSPVLPDALRTGLLWAGIPLIAAHALLRALTLRVRVTRHAVFVHRGFPLTAPVEIDRRSIRSVCLVQRPSYLRLGGGDSLVIELAGGRRIRVDGLACAGQAAAEIERAVRGATSPSVPRDNRRVAVGL